MDTLAINHPAATAPKLAISPQRAAGFNYGQGWPEAQDKPLYKLAEERLATLRIREQGLTKRVWEGEMALREMRLAETETERERAVRRLARWGSLENVRAPLDEEEPASHKPGGGMYDYA